MHSLETLLVVLQVTAIDGAMHKPYALPDEGSLRISETFAILYGTHLTFYNKTHTI